MTGVLDALREHATDRSAIILDDDPTGTQTVRDLFVLTEWDADRIARHLEAGEPALFLSTNSRALEEAGAIAVTRDAVRATLDAAERVGRPVSIVSRSDSTLRGHFPAETLAVAGAMGRPDARVLLAPFFAEGGRVTVEDVHLLVRDGIRAPVAETEFARDASFGYRSSDLRAWVAEKYAAAGRPTPPVASLPLHADAGRVAAALLGLPPGGVIVANAETDADIEAVALGALLAEEEGLPLVARTAASYVRARAGQPSAAPLGVAGLGVTGPGLMVVGSHVPTTTAQLQALVASAPEIDVQELSVEAVRGRDRSVLAAVAETVDEALDAGRSAVVMTERTRRDIGLLGGRAVSQALVEVVRSVQRRPGWVVAKGGITSYDVARDGLAMAEARVAGPLLPGVPVWVGTTESRWPGVPLVVFPGNVGGVDALLETYRRLTARA